MMPDRRLVLGAALAVALLVAVVQWIVLPVSAYRKSLGRDIASAEQALTRTTDLGEEYKALAAQTRSAGQVARPNQTLFALLESLAARGQLRGNIEFIRPSLRQGSGGMRHDVVEMRLNQVGLEQLVAFLESVDTAGRGIVVERLNLRAHDKRPLDVDLVFTALHVGS